MNGERSLLQWYSTRNIVLYHSHCGVPRSTITCERQSLIHNTARPWATLEGFLGQCIIRYLNTESQNRLIYGFLMIFFTAFMPAHHILRYFIWATLQSTKVTPQYLECKHKYYHTTSVVQWNALATWQIPSKISALSVGIYIFIWSWTILKYVIHI